MVVQEAGRLEQACAGMAEANGITVSIALYFPFHFDLGNFDRLGLKSFSIVSTIGLVYLYFNVLYLSHRLTDSKESTMEPQIQRSDDASIVCVICLLSRYMRPEGPWQRLRCCRNNGSGLSIHDLVPFQAGLTGSSRAPLSPIRRCVKFAKRAVAKSETY